MWPHSPAAGDSAAEASTTDDEATTADEAATADELPALLDGSSNEDEPVSGTYLPPSEVGSPRYMRDRCANALAVHRKLGKAALFITITTDLKDWPEVSTRTTSC